MGHSVTGTDALLKCCRKGRSEANAVEKRRDLRDHPPHLPFSPSSDDLMVQRQPDATETQLLHHQAAAAEI